MSSRRPTAPPDRLAFIDSLRGFALLGVFWANLLIFSGISYMTDEQRADLFAGPLDGFAYFFERFFIENKFMGLFSFLFGISFWLFIQSARSRGGAGTHLFYRRTFWLFAIGLIHGGLLWCFDVLRFYALWALLLPLFARTAQRRLLLIALSAGVFLPAVVSGVQVLIATPAESAIDVDAIALAAFSSGTYRDVLEANWQYEKYLTISVGQIAYQVAVFGRLLSGLYVARTLNLGDLARYRTLLRGVLVGGGMVGVAGSALFTGSVFAGHGDSVLSAFVRRLLIEGGQLGLTLSYASGLAMLFLAVRWSAWVRVFAPVGRMALTWYLFQTLFGIWLFYGFMPGPSLMGKVGPAAIAAIAVGGFVIQCALARAWLARFRFGPAEWLWRTATYWKVQPLAASSTLAGQQQHAADGASRRS